MKFFTADLLERFGSDHDQSALAAQSELELVETGRGKEFRHSILFSNGLELRLRFKDFDFATLKPIESMSELAEADH